VESAKFLQVFEMRVPGVRISAVSVRRFPLVRNDHCERPSICAKFRTSFPKKKPTRGIFFTPRRNCRRSTTGRDAAPFGCRNQCPGFIVGRYFSIRRDRSAVHGFSTI
jgi:hypothetical protein